MIGLIVTGHGHFGTGLTTSVELVAGAQENYVAVDFDGQGTEKLENDLRAAMESLKDCSAILVLSDLPGGSPMKTSVEVGMGLGLNVRVIAGTNLPMLMATCLMRGFMDDVDTLAASVLEEAKNGIMLWQMPTCDDEPADDEEGI